MRITRRGTQRWASARSYAPCSARAAGFVRWAADPDDWGAERKFRTGAITTLAGPEHGTDLDEGDQDFPRAEKMFAAAGLPCDRAGMMEAAREAERLLNAPWREVERWRRPALSVTLHLTEPVAQV